MKTIYGHCIINEKGTDYVFLKDYCKLLNLIEKQQGQMEDTKNFVKCLYSGGYISEMTQNNILERLKDTKVEMVGE